MFFNIFFLIIMLIMMTIASESAPPLITLDHPLTAISIIFFLYVFTIGLIYSQNIKLGATARKNKDKMFVLANIELFVFFIGYYFVFGIHHLLFTQAMHFSNTISVVFSLILYLTGITVFNYAQNILKFGKKIAYSKTWPQLLFMVPFFLPFLIFQSINDVAALLPWNNIRQFIGVVEHSFTDFMISALITIGFMVILIVFMPLAIVYFWRCKDLEASALKEELIAVCKKAQFKFAGLKTWNIIDSMNAAIIGVWAPFRYVMFTPSLLQEAPLSAIKAILAHEIGHSKFKHLLIYPFIVSGIFLLAINVTAYIYLPISQILSQLSPSIENLLSSILFFLLLSVILAVAFRLIFGYFSRLFERQADLFIFRLGLPASSLIEALDKIAIDSGNIHDVPNWHHYSIRQRINFLKLAEEEPSVIENHHKKVQLNLIIYFICFFGLIYITYVL